MMSKKNFIVSCVVLAALLSVAIFASRFRSGLAVSLEEKSEESTRKKFDRFFPAPKNMQRIADVVRSEDIDVIFDPAELDGLTDDEEAMKLIAYLSSNPPYGKSDRVKIARGSPDRLMLDGKPIFEGRHIYDYSISENGVIAVEAISDGEHPGYKNSNVDFSEEADFLPVSYGEIWVVNESGESFRVTDEDTNGSNPCISKNGKKLAFTANLLTVRNLSLEKFLLVVDLESGKTEKYSSPLRNKDHHVISPVMWINKDKTIRVIEDHGETGGHLTVGYVDF